MSPEVMSPETRVMTLVPGDMTSGEMTFGRLDRVPAVGGDSGEGWGIKFRLETGDLINANFALKCLYR